jgi:hypothetical protein
VLFRSGHHIRITAKAQTLETPIQIVGATPLHKFDDGCLSPPCFCLPVFNQDDKTRFLIEFPSTTSPYEFRLAKFVGGVFTEIETVPPSIPANGLIVDGFGFAPDYPERVKLTIDWSLIFDAYGAGFYKILVYTDLPEPKFYSDCFDLQAFSCMKAARTIKISSVLKGVYQREANRFDLKTMEHADEVRMYAKFLPSENPTNFEQILAVRPKSLRAYDAKMHDNYTLRIDSITFELYKRLVYFVNTGNELKISTYNDNDLVKVANLQALAESGGTINFNVGNQTMYNVQIPYRSAFASGFRFYR